jgi:hypothetical protein
MPRRAKKPVPETTSRSTTLVNRLKPKQTPEAAHAELVVAGLAINAVTALQFSKPFGDVDLTECLKALVDAAERVNRGDLGDAEALLMAQAVTLNAMFTQLANQSTQSQCVDQLDRYMRLALKAQGQCRATLETLAAIKNPPTLFARQANIAQGPQQVNNTLSLEDRDAQPVARAGNQETGQIEVLEAHDERVDSGTAGTAGARDQAVVPVGTLNRPTDG